MPAGNLYEDDYHAWALDQSARLRRLSQFRLPAAEDVDLDLIAEELEDQGHEQRLQVEAHLVKALKLLIEGTTRPETTVSRSWSAAVRACLDAASDRYTPSMAACIDLGQVSRKACIRARRELQEEGIGMPPLPDACPYVLGSLVSWEGDLRTLLDTLRQDR